MQLTYTKKIVYVDKPNGDCNHLCCNILLLVKINSFLRDFFPFSSFLRFGLKTIKIPLHFKENTLFLSWLTGTGRK